MEKGKRRRDRGKGEFVREEEISVGETIAYYVLAENINIHQQNIKRLILIALRQNFLVCG